MPIRRYAETTHKPANIFWLALKGEVDKAFVLLAEKAVVSVDVKKAVLNRFIQLSPWVFSFAIWSHDRFSRLSHERSLAVKLHALAKDVDNIEFQTQLEKDYAVLLVPQKALTMVKKPGLFNTQLPFGLTAAQVTNPRRSTEAKL